MNPLSASSLNAERARLDAARPVAAPASADGAGGFAQLLQGARDAGAPPKPADAPRADDEGAARAEAKEKAKAEAREGDEDDTTTDGTDAADDTERSDRPRETGPTLAHWLLNGAADPTAAGGALPPAQQAAAPTDDLKAAAMAREVLDAVRQRARVGAGGKAGEGADTPTAADATARRGDPSKAALRGADAAEAVAAVSDAGADATTRETARDGGKTEARFAEVLNHVAGHNAAPLGAAGDAAPAATAAAPTDPRVDTPVHDAGFGSAVGVTISRMAKDGLHQASLQLNPAELGPVAVRIEMQGHEARLSLSAAHAETRALLDASLPALTEAFRADGLVLAASQVGEMGREQGSGFAGQGGAGSQAQSDSGARGQWTGSQGGQGSEGRPSRGDGSFTASRVTQITMPLPAATPGRTRGGATGGLDLYA